MKKQGSTRSQAGQIILILILVMTVALGIGLSVIQKSLVDISTASKAEESSRAFSAAEAGVESSLQGNTNGQNFAETLSGFKNVSDSGLIPSVPAVGSRQTALEYLLLAKEDIVHIWLADPNANLPTCVYSSVCYNQSTLEVYWGNSSTDKAALELTLVYYDGSIYQSRKWYLDNPFAVRNPPNGFDTVNVFCGGNYSLPGAVYQCHKTLGDNSGTNNTSLLGPLNSYKLMLIRARLLYNTNSQPLAVQAVGTCGRDCSLPPQARQIVSTGISGETQRTVKLFQMYKVVPPFFDYALFSSGEINK